MAWWKEVKRQRGWMKAHEAKECGKYGRRAADKEAIAQGLEETDDEPR